MSNALLGWAGDAYGALDPFQTMRIVIPSLLALGIGAELALAACFLGFADYVESARREDSGRRD
jgi:hypothetical protein